MIAKTRERFHVVDGVSVSVDLEPDLSQIHVDFVSRRGVVGQSCRPHEIHRLYRFVDTAPVPESVRVFALLRLREAESLYRSQVIAMQPADAPLSIGGVLVTALLCILAIVLLVWGD